mgnify:FL=1
MPNPRLTRVRDTLGRTRATIGVTLSRRDGQLIFGLVTMAYLIGYLWTIGQLAVGLGGFGITLVADPLLVLCQSEGAFSYRPVARIALGQVTYLASLNTLVGGGVAALVGLNLSMSYLAWRHPAGCGIRQSSSGVIAGLPALLSGTACCGPVVLLAVGIQASSTLLTVFQFLLPLAVVLLLGSLVLVGRHLPVDRR